MKRETHDKPVLTAESRGKQFPYRHFIHIGEIFVEPTSGAPASQALQCSRTSAAMRAGASAATQWPTSARRCTSRVPKRSA